MVSITVDDEDEPKKFSVHSELLSQHSNFFKQAIGPDRAKTGQHHIIESPNDDQEAVQAFVRFTYTGGVYLAAENEGQEGGEGEDAAATPDTDDEFTRISACWEFGDDIGSTSFKDAVTDTLLSKVAEGNFHPTFIHRSIYAASQPNSGIRRLLVDIAVHMWKDTDLTGHEEVGECPEFYHDVLQALLRNRDTVVDWPPALHGGEDTCAYHDHVADRTPCYKAMF